MKISGEALLGDQEFGIDQKPIKMIADEIRKARDLGAELSSGAHLTNLIRTKSGNFTLENAAPLLDFVEVLEA